MRVGNFPVSNGEPFGTRKNSAPARARCAVTAGVQMSSHTGTPIVMPRKLTGSGIGPGANTRFSSKTP